MLYIHFDGLLSHNRILADRSFVLCGQVPSLLWTPARRPSIGPVRMPMETGRELVGVCGVCATCGRGRLSRYVRSLSGIYYSAPLRRGLLSDWPGWDFAATSHQSLFSAGPGGRLCSVARGQSHLSTCATPALADIHDATNHDAGDGHRF